MNVFNNDYLPKFLYMAELDLLHDALIDYPNSINLDEAGKRQVKAEIALRDCWAE